MVMLYDLPKGARIKEKCVNSKGKVFGEFIIFHHLDGMYSYCTIEGTTRVIHLSVTTPLRKLKSGYYKIIFPKKDNASRPKA